MRWTSMYTDTDSHPLFEFCRTDKQREAIQLRFVEGLTLEEAGKKAGVHLTSIHSREQSVLERAAKFGASPVNGFTATAPVGYAVKKSTTQFDGDGNVQKSWVSVNQDKEEQLDILCDRLESSMDGLEPFKPTKKPLMPDDDLLSLLTITDFHLGMYAWEAETGDDWDVNIARQVFSTRYTT